MIDTVKIYTMVNKEIYNKIYHSAIIKSSYNLGTGEIFYEIVNDHLIGSYDNRLSVRVGSGVKYQFVNNYYLEIEGSYHKMIKGYNAYGGFYDIYEIVKFFISAVESTYKIELPSMKHWFLQRIDIALCYDLKNNQNVRDYINNIKLCSYARRNIKHYQDESIYCTGTTTTLKIYNKLLEFKKHDMKKFYGTCFDLDEFMRKIDGFIRFECEVKKKKLESIYGKKYIRLNTISYKDLKKVWCDEFMKLLKLFESDLYVVRKKEDIKKRLYGLYTARQANLLYNFYICLMADGDIDIKERFSSTTYYRNIKMLKEAGVDLSQKYTLELADDYVYFNPFEAQEVL